MKNTITPEKFKITHLPKLLVETYKEWNADDPWRLSAVVAYYALLSLPAFLVIIINTVGYIWGTEIVQGKLTDEISAALGQDAAESIQAIIESAQADNKTILSTVIGIATLIYGATGIFYHLQITLNEIWNLKQDPSVGWRKLIFDRARSFGFVLIIGFLLLISFILSAVLSALTGYIVSYFGEVVVFFSRIVELVISMTVVTVLFALIFKYLPDAKIKWKSVWAGAFITALLFAIGKYLLSYYFGLADPGSTYGAAGSIVLMMLWVSYSSLILFFGAEFTFVYACRYGDKIEPDETAVRYVKKEKIIEE